MVTRLVRLLLCCLLLHAGALARAQTAAITLPPDSGRLSLAGLMQASPRGVAYADADAALAAYRSGQFEPLPGNLGRGYRRDDVWLAFDLDMTGASSDRLILEIGPAFLDRVTAYMTWRDGSVLRIGQAGDRVPPQSSPLPALKPTFTLPLPPGLERSTVLLHIQTSSTQSALVTLYTPDDFLNMTVSESLLLGGLFMISLGIMALTLALYVVQREPAFLLWLAYVFITSCLWFFRNGLAYFYLPLQQLEWFSIATNVLSALSAALLIVVGTYLFSFRKLSVVLHRLFVLWPAAVVIATGIGQLVDRMYIPHLLYMLSMPLVLLGNLVIVWLIWRRQRAALLFGVPHIVYSSLLVYSVMAYLGWVPFTLFSFYGWQVAGVFYLLALQLAVIERTRQTQQRHRQERQQLLTQLAHKKQELESRVATRTQELQRALEEISQAEHEQRQLLSMASHEFRTPAAMIKASLDSLRYLQAQIAPEVATRLDNIRQASQRLIRLTNDLISQDRLRERSLRPNLKRMDLRELVASVTAQYADAPWLRTELPASPVWIDADPALLAIALNNLIDNAVRYGEGQTLGVQVTLSSQVAEAVLRVADQGPGIDAAEKTRIFERFYGKGDSLPPQEKTSSGLGLFIVQSIARSHQGAVHVEDNRPHGSVFVLSLPLKERASAG